jgi:uncharacterized protein (TIGR02597 family)
MLRPTTLLAALTVLPLAVFAQSVSTDPVGFVTLGTRSNSDTIFSTPLARAEAFRGSVSTLSATTITAAGAPGWTPSAFVYAAGSQSNTFYLRFRTGAKAGSYYTVTANTTDTLTLDLAGDLLTGATAGDEFALIPYWTLGTVFPASTAGTAFESSASALSRKTEIFFLDTNLVGINSSALATFFFFNSAWRKVGTAVTSSFNDTPIAPDSYLIIRNKAFTGSIAVMGGVVTSPQATPLNSYATTKQDNYVAISYPIDVSLNGSRLIESGAFRASTSALVRTDELLVISNTATGINKSSVATYYYLNGGWRKVGSSVSTDFGTDLVFKAGTGAVIRKGVNPSGPTTTQWVFTAN